MQFPYSVAPPTWTSNGLPSMNTRPFLAVHRRKYSKVPRLFPVSTYAEQLCEHYEQFEWREFQTDLQRHGRRDSGKARLPSEDPLLATTASPPASDGEPARVSSKGLSRNSRLRFDDCSQDFQQVLRNASQAVTETRNAQRQSWQAVSTNPVAPPLVPHDGLLDSLINENLEKGCSRECQREEPAASGPHCPSWRGTGNSLSVTKVGSEYAVVCATTGLLESVGIYDVRTDRTSDGGALQRLVRRGTPSVIPNALVHEMSSVTDIVTADWDVGSSEPCRALIATGKALSLADLATHSGMPTCQWRDHFSFPASLSCALNPLYPDEFAALCEEGLFCGTPEDFVRRRNSGLGWDERFHDVQALEKDSVYNRVYYGPHPRTLLLSNQREIARFDLRMKVDLSSRDVLLNVGEDWNLPKYDLSISAFSPTRPRGNTLVVATKTCLNYCDLRMPKNPLLDWSLSLPLPVDQLCVTSLELREPQSEIVAMASRRQCYLEVFHAVHESSRPSCGFRPARAVQNGKAGGKSWKAPRVAKRSLLWSDLPLSNLQQLKGMSATSGIAVLPLNNQQQVTLLQWSAEDGLLGQLLDVVAREDEECLFERQTAVKGRIFDSSTNMRNFLGRLALCGDFKDLPEFQHPISKCTGASLLSLSKRLYLKDAMRLRPRVIRGEDDDITEDGETRLPRVYLSDIPRVIRLREKSMTGEDVDPVPRLDLNTVKHSSSREDDNCDSNSFSSDAVSGGTSSSGESNHHSERNSGDKSLSKMGRGSSSGEQTAGASGRTKDSLDKQGISQTVKGNANDREVTGRNLNEKRLGALAFSQEEVMSKFEGGLNSSQGGNSVSKEDNKISQELEESSVDELGRNAAVSGMSREVESQGMPLMQTQQSANMSNESSDMSSSGHSSSSGSSSSDATNSSEETGEMTNLMEAIGHGKTFDEIGRAVRAGMAHCATPLGPKELKKAVEESRAVSWFDVEWHSGCSGDHDKFPTAASTDEDLPDWVCTRVYRVKTARTGDAFKSGIVDEDSSYGKLLKRMRNGFLMEYEED